MRLALAASICCVILTLGFVPTPARADYTLRSIATFDGSTAGAGPIGGVSFDAQGNLYGVTGSGGASGVGTIYEVAQGSGVVTTLASFGGSNISRPAAARLAIDAQGDLFGTTLTSNGTGQTNASGYVFELAKGSSSISQVAVLSANNLSDAPGGLTLGRSGLLYGASYSNPALTSGGAIFSLAPGSSTLTTAATFTNPNAFGPLAGLTADAAGNLYGTTSNGSSIVNGAVFKFAPSTGTITRLAGASGPTSTGVAIDAQGNIYGATDPTGGRPATIFRIDAVTGAYTTVASFSATPSAFVNGGLVVDSLGDVFGTTVSGTDANNGRVFELDRFGVLTTLATIPTNGGRGGRYSQLTLDGQGNLFGTAAFGLNAANSTGYVFELSPNAVPGPASLVALGQGALALAAVARARRRAARVAS